MANKSKKRSSVAPEKKVQRKSELSPSSSKRDEKDVKRNEPLEEDSSDEEYDDVDEEGMAKLLNALGEDGLDEIGKMQLEILEQDEGSSMDEDDFGEGIEEVEESEAGGSSDGEEEEEEEEGEGVEDSAESGAELEDAEDLEDRSDNVVALEDAESVDEDAVPRQKIVTNNQEALERIRDTIKLDPKLSWTETLSVTYPETINVDVDDDLTRELAFYKQALHGANLARKLADQHKFPFTRPADYFAEMVKSDAHMERIRQRLLDETAVIKKSELKRKEREGKKFGKQVQIEKQKERERSKKEMEDRLKGLKRKRKDVLKDPQTNDDAFDVAVEDAISDRPSKRAKDDRSKISRKGRDAKFGFGGKGRRSKQNTRESTEKFDFGSRKGAGGKGGKSNKTNRPGKSKRMASRNR